MRILCPFHQEETPSLFRRDNDWFCFGACGKAFSLTEVSARVGDDSALYTRYREPDEAEDIKETFKYIRSLPVEKIRGLSFPCSETAYYICWPDDQYYKKRLFDSRAKAKYLGPKGHPAIPFFASAPGPRKTWMVVEGEINAMSCAIAFPDYGVVSPGSAVNFKEEFCKRLVEGLTPDSRVIVVLDNDSAGLKALMRTKAHLLYKIPFVKFVLMKIDANEVLCEFGQEGLRKKLLWESIAACDWAVL